jgi:uncharacterized membrane protein
MHNAISTKKVLYLIIGIVSLSFAYILFTQQQNFSLIAMSGIFALALLSGILFVFPHLSPSFSKRFRVIFPSLTILSAILILYEYFFDLPSPGLLLGAAGPVFYVSLATAISLIGIYALGRFIQRSKGNKFLYSVIGIVIVSALAYSSMYVINSVNWNGVDETAYNYYSAYLLVHGQNPYTQSMQPILHQYNIFPTVQLDGTYEYAYSYPAFSFLPFVFIPLLGITSLMSLIAVLIFISVAASFAIYYKSGFNRLSLVLIAGWLFATYSLVGVVATYLSVSLLLLLAYLYRERSHLSGFLGGLAASTTQLSWFALPFFLILTYREHGRRAAIKFAAYGAFAFLLINGYFLIASPSQFLNIFGLLGTSKLPYYGPNIMQFIGTFYLLPQWYTAVISGITLIALLALYYMYTERLRPLLAVVPMLVFFISWRNISIYGLSYLPLLIAIYFERPKEIHKAAHKLHDLAKTTLPIAAVPIALIAFAVILAVPLHNSTINGPGLAIQHAWPILEVQQGYYGTQFALIGVKVELNNTSEYSQNVSFYVVSRSPNNEAYILGSELNVSMAHTVSNYTINYQLPLVDNGTELLVSGFSTRYTYTKILNLSSLGNVGCPPLCTNQT